MNKPIPAIIRFREKFTIKTKEGLNLDDGKNIYAGSRGLTEDIETFLVAELLNERERILKEVEEKVLKGIDMNTDDFGQYDYKALGSYMFNLLGFLERFKSEKEGGE